MTKQKTILICDDSIAVHESLHHFLGAEGMKVLSAFTGAEMMAIWQSHPVDLILLDIMLPDGSGTQLCREIRKSSQIPIVFLSAKGEEIDRVLGLELGADDYVTKPFSAREVTLRIRNLLLRSEGAAKTEEECLRFEELRIYPEKIEVYVGAQSLEMTAKETALLAYMARNAGKVLNREQILHNVWGYDYYGDTRAVDAAVKRIRRKLPKEGMHFALQSVYGVGYRLGRAE
ncbi:MAG: response regulator transcription factor [Firmicutes bacterium]|nr:response regulator transcription factor [Bacillota bacterium]